MQPPSVALRVVLLATVAVALIGIIVFRLWFLQILSAQQYVAQANDNRLRTVAVLAPRGTMLDRNGIVIVDNRPGPRGRHQAHGRARRRARPPRQAPRPRARHEARRRAPGDGPPGGRALEPDHDGPRPAVRLRHDQAGHQSRASCRTCSSTPPPTPASRCARTTCATIRWASWALTSSDSSARSALHELTEASFRGYKAGDVVGQSGVEYTYDKWLRGINGSVRVEVDASGRPKQVVPGGTLPQAGDNLQLSIDAKVQRAAENAVNYGIDLAHANNELRADGGAAVVLDAHTGAVIAMASEPNVQPGMVRGWPDGQALEEAQRQNDAAARSHDPGRLPDGLDLQGGRFGGRPRERRDQPIDHPRSRRHLHQPRPAVARLGPQRPRRHRPDPGDRAVVRHVLLPGRLRLLPAQGQRPRELGAAPGPGPSDRHRPARRGRRPGADARAGSTRPSPRRPIPRAGRSTASGSRATRSTSPSARATSRRLPCRPP